MPNVSGEWETVKLAVAEALELASSERAGFLERRCEGNSALLAEALSLVSAAASSDGLLSPRLDTWLGMDATASAADLSGRRVGRYTLERVLGEGSSGVVYLARQDSPHRAVAVKLLRSVMPMVDSGDRFMLEAAALGRVRHPSVAQIYEAGVHRTESGASLPYIAMEYVPGPNILEHARSLGRREILELVARVAEAIHAAHQRAVIHRDLKPSNVLVDESGVPKVVDFGIARITAEGFRTRLTSAGSLLGTPGYMSPEQAGADDGETDVRTDVWSLGAMLYELLSGRPPVDTSAATPAQALRRVLDADPAPLGRVMPGVGRDLECIVMTALSRRREDRYASAQAMADDLRRFMADEAISVRPPSRVERMGRFVRRHRAGVAVAGLFAAVVAVSAVGLWVTSRRAADERDRALAVNALLQGMISAADPNFGDRGVTMLAALSGLESRLGAELSGRPGTEADVRSALGSMLFSIAEYGRSREHLERAIELRAGLGDHRGRLADQTSLAMTLRWLYEPERAGALIAETASECDRRLGRGHPSSIRAWEVLAGCAHDQGRLDDAESAYRGVVQRSTQRLGASDERTLSARSGLASVLIDGGRYAEAEAELRGVILVRESLGGTGARESLTLRANLALALAEQGKLAEALAEQRALADRSAAILGPAHDSTATARLNLAESLRRSGDSDAALALNRLVVEECARELGWTHHSTLSGVEGAALLLVRLERFDEAAELICEARSRIEPVLGEESDWVHRVRSFDAAVLSGTGRHEEALSLYRACLDHAERRQGPESSQAIVLRNNYATALIAAGRGGEAAAILSAQLGRLGDRFESMHPVLRRNLGHALMIDGRLEEAVAELTAARDSSMARGEAENAARCERLLAELEGLRR
jgi:tetratricopeptide (TPR) repeat protein